MTPLQLVLSKLPDAKPSGKGWTSKCPAHEDRRPSLSISENGDRQALIHCHSGKACSVELICKKLGITVSDLFPKVRTVRFFKSVASAGRDPVYRLPDVIVAERVYVTEAQWRSEQRNFRTWMHRISRRAGLQPWPRVFHNLRASLQTELQETFPSHVVCSWLGNSERVAREHYLQVTDSHFARATGDEAVQNPVQQPAALGRTEPQVESPNQKKTVVLRRATRCDLLRESKVHPEGVERVGVTSCASLNLRDGIQGSAAESGAVGAISQADADLQRIANAWASLTQTGSGGHIGDDRCRNGSQCRPLNQLARRFPVRWHLHMDARRDRPAGPCCLRTDAAFTRSTVYTSAMGSDEFAQSFRVGLLAHDSRQWVTVDAATLWCRLRTPFTSFEDRSTR